MEYTRAIQTLFREYVNTDDYFEREFMLNKVPNMLEALRRLNISMEDVDDLNIIHVTGTKGKGSTCAFTESLLRHHGYATGLFVSPHMVEIRERILINGLPLDKSTFAKYFFEVHNQLQETKNDFGARPVPRFGMYVLLAMHVFIKEKVDVVVLEVGVGGEYDCTNFIRKPWVCLMTSIALDHKEELGGTLENVAWNKAGIFKAGAVAFMGQIKDQNVLEVIKSRSAEENVPVYFAPEFSMYEHSTDTSIKLGVPGRIQESNASIALQAVNYWICRRLSLSDTPCSDIDKSIIVHNGNVFPVAKPFSLSKVTLEGLSNARINCRHQIVRKPGITYYIDGAHTYESLKISIEWFEKQTEQETKNLSGKCMKILLFYLAPNRTPEDVMPPLAELNVDAVGFVPFNLYPEGYMLDRDQESSKQKNWTTSMRNMRMWHKLKGTKANENQVFNCVRDALKWATQGRDKYALRTASCIIVPFTDDNKYQDTESDIEANDISTLDADHIQILVTGGLAYSGGALHLVKEIRQNS